MSASYTVRVRYGDQELDVREFVLPRGYMVAQALESIQASPSANGLVWDCWDWVCRQVQYPPLPLATADYHREECFLRGRSAPGAGFMPIKRSTKWEFWQFPFETIDHGLGDCDDVSILTCSLLRNVLPADEVHVAVGKVDPYYYHAWVSVIEDGQRYILETTLDQAFPGEPCQVLEANPYQPLLYFNDEQAFEAYEGAFQELKQALPQEEIKLRLIREIYQVARLRRAKGD